MTELRGTAATHALRAWRNSRPLGRNVSPPPSLFALSPSNPVENPAGCLKGRVSRGAACWMPGERRRTLPHGRYDAQQMPFCWEAVGRPHHRSFIHQMQITQWAPQFSVWLDSGHTPSPPEIRRAGIDRQGLTAKSANVPTGLAVLSADPFFRSWALSRLLVLFASVWRV
jgi:hypothetical protein